jgi:hypothetical protein
MKPGQHRIFKIGRMAEWGGASDGGFLAASMALARTCPPFRGNAASGAAGIFTMKEEC